MAPTKRRSVVALFATVWICGWLLMTTLFLISDVAAVTLANCRPKGKITQAQCATLIRQCSSLGVTMKWTGKGCRQGKKKVGDGGCQCQNYCGYTCKQACNADRTCTWNSTQDKCYSIASGEPGQGQATCNLPSSSPISSAIPSASPSAMPSASPSAMPSASPTVSMAPTTSPTQPGCPALSPRTSPAEPGEMLFGVQRNIEAPTGWHLCFCNTYNVILNQALVASIMNACTKTNLMLACRPGPNANLTVAAMAPRVDVLTNTGRSNTPHDANGVGWYFTDTYSWGFAAQGEVISRSACDLNVGANRMCWHTTGQTGGYSCGSTINLSTNHGWVRLVYQAD